MQTVVSHLAERRPESPGPNRPTPLLDWRWGLEKETLRVDAAGRPSRLRHPAGLPRSQFTTDFAEAQMELVTTPEADAEAARAQLGRLVDEAQAALAPGEMLWPHSMPPDLAGAEAIALAEPEPTAVGVAGRRYREGLALRYGPERQLICGLHVNVSMGDRLLRLLGADPADRASVDALYLKLARGLYARLPLLTLLYSFTPLAGEPLARFGQEPILSRRKGCCGYPEWSRFLSLTSLEAYGAGISRARALPYLRPGVVVEPPASFGLNDRLLQRDQEFYVPIRLKPRHAARESEDPTLDGLAQSGIGYLELRFADLDPREPAGISSRRLHLLQLVLLQTALDRDPVMRDDRLALLLDESRRFANHRLDRLGAIAEGVRERWLPELTLLRPLAARLDRERGKAVYTPALEEASRELDDLARLPSARLWREYLASGARGWTEFGRRALGGEGGEEARGHAV